MTENFVTEQLCAARREMDDERFGRDKTRLDKAEKQLEGMGKVIYEISECNAKLTIMVENLSKSNEDHEKRLTEIEMKPGTYWDKIIAGIIGAAVAALMAAVMRGGV